MGGFMPYGRVRNRNGLVWRPDPDSEAVYPPPGTGRSLASTDGLVGDLNRMERDYLDPPAELTRRCGGPDSSTECSMATGVDVDTVRRVLHHVFRESH